MLKILHLGNSLAGGGAQSVFRDTVLVAKRNTNNINLVAARQDSNGISGISLDCKFPKKYKGRKSIISQVYSRTNFKILQEFLYQEEPDIIHFHGYGLLSPSILHCIHKYKQNRKVTVIQTVHTYELLCSHFAGFDYKKNSKCLSCSNDSFKYKIFFRRCSRGGAIHSYGRGLASLIGDFFIKKGVVDKYVFPSNFLMNKVKNSNRFNNSKTTLIRNPINPVFFDNDNHISDNELSEFKIVYFGRLSVEKDVETIIKSISRLKNKNIEKKFKLYIIGSGDEFQILNNLSIELNLQDNITFIPFMKTNDLFEFLKTCHISIMSSKCFETASLVVIESILSNLIPIIPDHGAYLELQNLFNCNVFFKGGNVEDLSNKIIYTLNNFQQLKESVLDAKKEVYKEYNLNNYLDQINNLYNI